MDASDPEYKRRLDSIDKQYNRFEEGIEKDAIKMRDIYFQQIESAIETLEKDIKTKEEKIHIGYLKLATALLESTRKLCDLFGTDDLLPQQLNRIAGELKEAYNNGMLDDAIENLKKKFKLTSKYGGEIHSINCE